MLALARCTNHDSRQASGLCVTCARAYCRECLTEHADRLICSACLRRTMTEALPQTSRFRGLRRRMTVPGMMAAALLGSWFLFYATGVAMQLMTEPPEHQVAK